MQEKLKNALTKVQTTYRNIFFLRKNLLFVLIFSVLLISIPLTVFVAQQSQDIRQQAADKKSKLKKQKTKQKVKKKKKKRKNNTTNPNEPPTNMIRAYQVRVLYVLPSDGVDEGLGANGSIETSVAAFQQWLKNQSGQTLRMATKNDGRLDIATVRLKRTDAQIAASGPFVLNELEKELQTLGFNNPRELYAIYYGGDSTYACGGGMWPPTLIGHVAGMYLKSDYKPPFKPGDNPETVPEPCSKNALTTSINSPGYMEFAMIHEIFHTLGAVPACSPRHTRAGHTSDYATDLMYAGDEDWTPKFLDVRRDDYYGENVTCGVNLQKSLFMTPTAPDAVPPPGW